MNQKIAELKKRAIVETVEHYSWGDPAITHHLDIEKFAKLIIQECADFVDSELEKQDEMPCVYGDQIKQHFEVN